jgi:hypothetical protein
LRLWQVSSIVELIGIIICLHSAAKISHRALSLPAVTSRWHALVTCNSNDVSQRGISSYGGNLEAGFSTGSLTMNYSESDLESIDYVPVPTNTQRASYISMYHKRQAFGTPTNTFCTIVLKNKNKNLQLKTDID